MELRQLLNRVKSGELDPLAAAELIEQDAKLGGRTLDLGFANLDIDREQRTGFPEVIYGQGKSADQIVAIIDSLTGVTDRIIASRVDEDKARAIMQRIDGLTYDRQTRLLIKRTHPRDLIPGHYVAVVCAGTSDVPVAEEAATIAECAGVRAERIYDVGVAGIHRLFRKLDIIRGADAVVVVAGMEGALASVVGGLVSRPVVAVPTSIGYGANLHGISALLSMLNSCAPGIAVVNIVNGFGAGYYAAMIVRTIQHKNSEE